MLKFGLNIPQPLLKQASMIRQKLKKNLKSEYGFTVMFIDYVHNMLHG